MMNDKEIIEHFLGIKKTYCKEELNFNIHLNCSKRDFEIEFEKFCSFSDYFYYDYSNHVLLTSINSDCIIFEEKTLKYIFNLLDKSKEYEDELYKSYISEFIYTYTKSLLENKKYTNGIDNYRDYKALFLKYFEINGFDEHTDEIYINIINLYDKLIEYSKNNNYKLTYLIKDRIFNNCNGDKKNKNRYFDYFIENDKPVRLFDYDYNHKKHIKYYEKYLENDIKLIYGFDDFSKLILKMADKKLLSDRILVQLVNKCIDYENTFIDELKIDDNLVKNIGDIEIFNSYLNILKRVSTLKGLNNVAEKIKECINVLLYAKRKLLKKEEAIEKGMHKFSFEYEVNESDLLRLNKIVDDPWQIYKYVAVDFDKELHDAIERYSKSPLSFLTSTILIDSKNQIYKYTKKFQSEEHAIINYYEKEGKECVKRIKDNLTNIPTDNYYQMLMQNARQTAKINVDVITSLLLKKSNSIIYKIRDIYFEAYDFKEKQEVINNDFILLTLLIKSIEEFIYGIAKRCSVLKTNDMKKNLMTIFDCYKENDKYRNCIINTYFFLYSKDGLRIRHDIMHGNAFLENYTELILIVFACWIGMYYVYVEECK